MIRGYFTIERNIVGLTPIKMQRKLGFPPGYLNYGARIFLLKGEPQRSEFIPAGSTLFPAGKGLDAKELERTMFRPGSWLGQRLVKVRPSLELAFESWPRADGMPAEQWILTGIGGFPAYEIAQLKADQEYWPRGT